MSEVMFETDRLLVRHFEMADLDEFAALCADPQVVRYVDDGQPLARADVERWIGICQQKYADRGYGTSAVFEKRTGRFIGFCGVVRAPANDFDELIYVYHVDTWGNGYATEAGHTMISYVFQRSTLDRIYATIHPDNTPSINVACKLGLGFERQEIDDDGTPVQYYVIERGQWQM